MSRNVKYSQKAVALIKFFSEEKHYLAFKNGHSLLRTPHYYRCCEDLGRGDRNESCLGYWDRDLGDVMPHIKRDGSSIDMTEVKSVLIYPAHEQRDAWLQSWCLIGPDNRFEETLQRMIDEFGSYFALLPATNIDAYVNLLKKASGLAVRYGLVQYSQNPLERSLTIKNSSFSYQKEIRFYLGECEKDERLDKNLHLEGLDNLLSDAASLKLTNSSGDITYFCLGQKKVVSASA
jgi:hypothetical protein